MNSISAYKSSKFQRIERALSEPRYYACVETIGVDSENIKQAWLNARRLARQRDELIQLLPKNESIYHEQFSKEVSKLASEIYHLL